MLDVVDTDLSDEMRERMEGKSLLPLIQEDQEPSFDVVITEKEMRSESALRFGFRTRRWKYLYDGKKDEHELYDLENDPEETKDVSDEHDEKMAEFQELLRERLDTIERTSADVEVPDINDMLGVEERLEALGYK
jgi:arylsulfatase A-like enzyme